MTTAHSQSHELTLSWAVRDHYVTNPTVVAVGNAGGSIAAGIFRIDPQKDVIARWQIGLEILPVGPPSRKLWNTGFRQWKM
jgi:hypothetical protein